ncbi:extracellular solute-binding protein [Paenibacillus sp. EC2-1]|uniref:extracellular solute-binding protein n=1 Tax=Paenibacillus sp. EC2-1 TaxID=3388665 RepID=UPI003BEF0F40
MITRTLKMVSSRHRKTARAILAFTLIGSLMAGCSKETQTPTANGNVDKPASSFSYWSTLDANASSSVTQLGEVEFYKELEKRTGIKINFSHPPVGSEDEQFNLLIASRDLPDMMEYGWLVYPGGPEKAIKDKVIIELNDLIDKHAPNIKKYLDENPEISKQVKTDNGVLYVVPSIGTGTVNTFSGPLVRKDWLEETGLQTPETIDEWTTMLRAFKEKQGATAPFTMLLNRKEYDIIVGAFGVNREFYLDNGQVKFGPMEPGFKDYLSLMREWYKEGLLDPDIGANDKKTLDAKMASGKSGAVYGFAGSSIGVYMNANKDKDPKYDLTAVQYPVLRKGDKPKFVNMADRYRMTGSVAITTKNPDPVSAIKWLDYYFTEEGNILKNFGVEGLTYTNENGYPKYTDLILKNPDNLSIAQAMGKYLRSNYPSPGFVNDDRYLEQYYQLPQQQESIKVWGKYEDNTVGTKMPLVSATPEESEQLAKIMAEVNTYADEMYIRFVQGQESLDNFDKYVEQMKKMKIEEAIQLQQAAVERFNKR